MSKKPLSLLESMDLWDGHWVVENWSTSARR